MFQLQKIQFPNERYSLDEAMFYRNPEAGWDGKCLHIPCGEKVTFSTYFNSFSIGKWKKYTNLQSLFIKLRIKGACEVNLIHARLDGDEVKRKKLERFELLGDGGEHTFEFPMIRKTGMYYFTLTAKETELSFFGGEYFTKDEPLREVNIAVNICTFKREEFLAKNLHALSLDILENKGSALNGHLQIFVIDNGQTINPEAYTNPAIHVFPNRNLGGAGGFGRGMYEIRKLREEYNLTHIIMMDDDIVLNPEVLARTYSFLRLIKQKYANAFIGGAMFNLEKRRFQTRVADYFNRVVHHRVKPSLNMCKLKNVLDNEIEEPINFQSWWYCCMPTELLREDNFPLPIFIKRDDIEYGLRNGKTFITLNGINVWHQAFIEKRSPYLMYYYFRNLCIMNAIRQPDVTREEIFDWLYTKISENIEAGQYQFARLCIEGVKDFCKGVSWLTRQDAVKLNQKILESCKLNKDEPQSNEKELFIWWEYERVKKIALRRYRAASKSYRKKAPRITSLKFWRKYLFEKR